MIKLYQSIKSHQTSWVVKLTRNLISMVGTGASILEVKLTGIELRMDFTSSIGAINVY